METNNRYQLNKELAQMLKRKIVKKLVNIDVLR